MKRMFYYHNDKSNQFGSIQIDGVSLIVHAGAAGTSDQTRSESFADETNCRAAADALIAEKTRKEEYVEDEQTGLTAGIGRHVLITAKRTLEQVILNYDVNGTKLGVTNSGGDRIYEYGSSEALLNAISDFKEQYIKQDYVWSWTCTKTTRWAGASGLPCYPKPQALQLFTPFGQPTRIDIATTGQKKIPCKKRIFIRDTPLVMPSNSKYFALYCDLAGRRILNPTAYRSDYVWTFETEDETLAAFENMKNKNIEDGCTLTFDEIVNYAFDFFLERATETANAPSA